MRTLTKAEDTLFGIYCDNVLGSWLHGAPTEIWTELRLAQTKGFIVDAVWSWKSAFYDWNVHFVIAHNRDGEAALIGVCSENGTYTELSWNEVLKNYLRYADETGEAELAFNLTARWNGWILFFGMTLMIGIIGLMTTYQPVVKVIKAWVAVWGDGPTVAVFLALAAVYSFGLVYFPHVIAKHRAKSTWSTDEIACSIASFRSKLKGEFNLGKATF